jgi:hypothetical protein
MKLLRARRIKSIDEGAEEKRENRKEKKRGENPHPNPP